jgi:hypothetical protein
MAATQLDDLLGLLSGTVQPPAPSLPLSSPQQQSVDVSRLEIKIDKLGSMMDVIIGQLAEIKASVVYDPDTTFADFKTQKKKERGQDHSVRKDRDNDQGEWTRRRQQKQKKVTRRRTPY